ncbi:MAG: acyl-CoA dehydratase activase-related protein [Tissierellia bacterium]|nr:acyl-CoA dehydratase activase-related protein [Tissierellia bacterium]
MRLHTGLDIGSTTVKTVVLDQNFNLLYQSYERHYSDVRKTVQKTIENLYRKFKYDSTTFNITGSGGIKIHEILDVDFVQEVVAGTKAIQMLIPQTDVAIELGGEDSKITYLKGAVEQRMNSICAGGTGAFIDQMAGLLQTDAAGLDKYANNYKKIYPIASRCGVFAKTDIQALVNQGATKEDISASVFQSVVNQTISNLACGRPIRGKVAFLGGPLYFLPNLKKRFIETLNLSDDEIIVAENPQLFVAKGAAMSSIYGEYIPFVELLNRINNANKETTEPIRALEPLFSSEEELESFKEKHKTKELKELPLEDYKGPLYLGIDAGSTTTKLLLIDDDENIRYKLYSSNKGKPLEVVINALKDIYQKMNKDAYIKASGITGYGEDFIKAALNLDVGEVETIAHLTAAQFFEPKVDFILDIGGQDMKSMRVDDGVISSILLNEACSSGCGSFLETFANSVNLDVAEFTKLALLAQNPVDLGSRCTVFMNSMVKQAQKDGAKVGDIAAGLAYSIIKNAIQKVIKVRDPSTLGEHILVQGGTFYGDAILRAFEKITGRDAIRPSIAGLMGALGIAIIAKEKQIEKSGIIDRDSLDKFDYKVKQGICHQCTNNCALNINIFPNGKRYITGNRCEKGAGAVSKSKTDLPNMYAYKYKRTFDYESLNEKNAKRGRIGIPRVLNIYENYPFWHTFLTELGFSVVLSGHSNRELYEKGIESIASETACYPAKIAHGHVEELIDMGVKKIFHPSVFYEEREFETADNTLNCPVVCGYTEVLKHNIERIKEENIEYLNPFISLDNRKRLEDRMAKVFKDIPKSEIKKAVRAAYEEQDRYKDDIRAKGIEALEYIDKNEIKAIVLAGRPYHIDPEINHGIPELVNSLGLAVLSEDSIANTTDVDGRLRVLDQWNYHSRLYRAAKFVGTKDNLELVQLNSFGCGLDAVTTDQVAEILKGYNKIYTAIKIDEVNNLGAIKIRLRSLLEASRGKTCEEEIKVIDEKPIIFTEEMAKDYTILMPQMAPIHFEIFQGVMESEGYKIEVLQDVSHDVINEGLKYVNNDACYPSMFVVGQFIDAIKSGKYDNDKICLLMSQTGGACRASNYVGFIRRALKDAGYGHIPVLALSFQGIEQHPGFQMTFKQGRGLFTKAVKGMLLGDLIMRLTNQIRPYEKLKGSTNMLMKRWIQIARGTSIRNSKKEFKQVVDKMIKEFSALETTEMNKPRVGIVGEILVKYLPAANNNVQDLLETEGAEVVIPDMTDFLMYSFANAQIKADRLSKNRLSALAANLGIMYIESYRKYIREALKNSIFDAPPKLEELIDYAEEFVDLGNQYGEGWLLTAEMVELIHMDTANIVMVQPFGCLPNHITGKGVMKAIRDKYPQANIIPIDYDASASEVNQQNRIKLMMSRAGDENVKTKGKEKKINLNMS